MRENLTDGVVASCPTTRFQALFKRPLPGYAPQSRLTNSIRTFSQTDHKCLYSKA